MGFCIDLLNESCLGWTWFSGVASPGSWFLIRWGTDIEAIVVAVSISLVNLLRTSAWLLRPFGNEVSPSTRNWSKIARTWRPHCYPHVGNDGLSWCLGSSLPRPVAFFLSRMKPCPCHKVFSTIRTLFTCSLNCKWSSELGQHELFNPGGHRNL